jgi:hypothetical protein
MTIYLQAAKNKFYSDRSVDYNLSFNDFVCECYVKLTPNSYGAHIQNKLIQDLNLIEVPSSENRGDFSCCDKYCEFKVSFFSNKTETYSITHIRPWQNLDYYLLCFVDCTKNFTPNFYLLDKHIVHRMRLGYMNGTPDANSHNHNVELRITIKKDSEDMKIIKKFNLLKDTSLDTLKKYIKSLK